MRTADGYIISQCLDGDSAAFGVLVDKYRACIYALAYSRLHNFHDAEDVAQEVFIKAYRKLSTLRRYDSFHAWLYSITSNLCKEWMRKQSRRPDRGFIDDQNQEALGEVSVDSYRDELVCESIHDALSSLPENHQQVLMLYYLGGMNSREIGEFLAISSSAVRYRLIKARSQLREGMLATMSTTFDEHRLPASFTLHLVEAVKRIKVNPMSRSTALPWGLSLAAGIILTVISLSPHVGLPNPASFAAGLPIPAEMEAMETSEIPVDMVGIFWIPAISSKQADSDGGEVKLSEEQNVLPPASRAGAETASSGIDSYGGEVGVANLKASSGRPYVVAEEGLSVGSVYHTDRVYTITSVPQELEAETYIMTSMDDKGSRGDELLKFTLESPAIVWVGYDSSGQEEKGGHPPAWLSEEKGWEKHPYMIIGNTGVSKGFFIPWSKEFDKGEVVLGGNRDEISLGEAPMYIVLLTDSSKAAVIFRLEEKIANPGQQFTMNVFVHFAKKLHRVTFDLTFDPEVLQAVSVKEGPFSSRDGVDATLWGKPEVNNEKGIITNIQCRRTEKSDVARNAGILATVVFKAIKMGSSEVSPQNLLLLGQNEEEIPAWTRAGPADIFPYGSISGVVRDAESKTPISRAKIEVQNRWLRLGTFGHSDKDGKYTIDGVPVGNYGVTADKYEFGYLPITIEVHVKQGEITSNVDLEMKYASTSP